MPGGHGTVDEVAGGMATTFFEVEEVFTEPPDLIVLSLGFASAHDPYDVLHFACGRPDGPETPETPFHVERTDQDLACSGRDVVSLTACGDRIELVLSDAGMRALGLERRTSFRFGTHPELYPVACRQVAAMAIAGQRNVFVADRDGDVMATRVD